MCHCKGCENDSVRALVLYRKNRMIRNASFQNNCPVNLSLFDSTNLATSTKNTLLAMFFRLQILGVFYGETKYTKTGAFRGSSFFSLPTICSEQMSCFLSSTSLTQLNLLFTVTDTSSFRSSCGDRNCMDYSIIQKN